MFEKEIDELFFTRKIEKKNNKNIALPMKKGYGLRNLIAYANNVPQVVIKIPRRHGNSKGINGIANHLDYISRNGKLEIEDQEGNLYTHKKEIKEIIKNLQCLFIPKNSNKREAINFVFSMPPKTNPASSFFRFSLKARLRSRFQRSIFMKNEKILHIFKFVK